MVSYLIILFVIVILAAFVAWCIVPYKPKKYVNSALLIAAMDNPRIMEKVIGKQ